MVIFSQGLYTSAAGIDSCWLGSGVGRDFRAESAYIRGKNGGPCRARTYDHRIKSPVLYQLS